MLALMLGADMRPHSIVNAETICVEQQQVRSTRRAGYGILHPEQPGAAMLLPHNPKEIEAIKSMPIGKARIPKAFNEWGW